MSCFGALGLWASDTPCAWQVFYRSNPAREAFVEMCESEYVQRMTFDSYLYKTVVPGVQRGGDVVEKSGA